MPNTRILFNHFRERPIARHRSPYRGIFSQTVRGQASRFCSSSTNVTFFGNNLADLATGQPISNPRMTTYSLFDLDLLTAGKKEVFSLNRFNYDNQAALLLPRAVGYSAGLLNYFF